MKPRLRQGAGSALQRGASEQGTPAGGCCQPAAGSAAFLLLSLLLSLLTELCALLRDLWGPSQPPCAQDRGTNGWEAEKIPCTRCCSAAGWAKLQALLRNSVSTLHKPTKKEKEAFTKQFAEEVCPSSPVLQVGKPRQGMEKTIATGH